MNSDESAHHAGETVSDIDPAALARKINGNKTGKVLCVGDLMLDRFVYGAVERISPEAPIPVLRIGDQSEMLGGAGNVVRNLSAMNVETTVIGSVGDDEAGTTLQEILKNSPGIDARLLPGPTKTTLKTRYVADGQQVLRADREEMLVLDDSDRAQLVRDCEALLGDVEVMVLSDYGKGLLSGGVAAVLIKRAKQKNVRVVVDPKDPEYSVYHGASVITPNLKELRAAAGRPVDQIEDLVSAAQELRRRHAIESVVVTRGRRGLTVVSDQIVHIDATAREVFDVSGAGDTVVAALSFGLASGLELPEAAWLANAAGGIVVGKAGTASATRQELLEALATPHSSAERAKILNWEDLQNRVRRWKEQGLRVGFTNGCFDLLHPGHVSLLTQAKSQCGKLVVAINSDRSVSRLKGDNRPVQTQHARTVVLASLAPVDAVVVFDQDTPLELIEALQPDVLVKGADYAASEVVGADLVRSYGGRLFLAQLEDGFSTTQTITRMAN